MKHKIKFWIGLSVLALATSTFAVDKKKVGMTISNVPDAAMMQAIKLGMPGANHQMLEPLIGKWNCTVRGWMKPGDKAEESKGTAENSWVMSGRFLKQDFKGDWAGQPFEGTGYTGYDNVRAEYQSIWMDSMTTGIMHSAGTYDPASKTLAISGQFSCPMTGEKEKWMRSELKIIDNDNNAYTAYFKTPDGKEFKSMEITYKRVK